MKNIKYEKYKIYKIYKIYKKINIESINTYFFINNL